MDKAATKVVGASQIIFNARVETSWSLSHTLLQTCTVTFVSIFLYYFSSLPLPRAYPVLNTVHAVCNLEFWSPLLHVTFCFLFFWTILLPLSSY